ncbi:protein FliZ [Salmonella enterica subsp. enterica serovar Choleraesuis]|nr:protein FliZ [Salmonella enterica subsp. enterica serovar Choleraesuis]
MASVRRRALSRYLKDFKMSQTHCAECGKGLDRATLIHGHQIVNKVGLAEMDIRIDESTWLAQRSEWRVVCRFCGEVQCCKPGSYFDIQGFKRYLQTATDIRSGTIREYVVRLRRFDNYLAESGALADLLSHDYNEERLESWLPEKQAISYRIALRKYSEFIDSCRLTPGLSRATPAIF